MLGRGGRYRPGQLQRRPRRRRPPDHVLRLGGGVIGNAFTYPVPHPAFCYDVGHCLFVVSHWDRDHYNTMDIATASTHDLDNMTALVPQQVQHATRVAVSGTAHSLIREITVAPVNATLHVWRHENPAALSGNYVAAFGHFAVIKVTGNNINNRGLAVRLEAPGVPGRYMLLTGDATFQHPPGHLTFPHNCDQHCVGLAAGHHGAPVETPADVPRPDPAAGSFLIAYSFGWGNSHGHPTVQGGVDAYDGRGWVDDHRMDTGGAELAARYAGPRGNVGLLWPGAALGPGAALPGLAAAAVNAAAVALLASAAAETEVASVGLAAAEAAAWRQVAAGAVAQAAAECGAPAVAGALAAANTVALTAAAAATPPVAPALAGAIAAAPAAFAATQVPAAQALARALTDLVMLTFARAAQLIAELAMEQVDQLPATTDILEQAKAAAKEAYGAAEGADVIAAAGAAIPGEILQRAAAAAAVSPAGVPTAGELRTAVAGGTCHGVQGRLGQPGAGFNSGRRAAGPGSGAARASWQNRADRGESAVGLRGGVYVRAQGE
ncbi:MAG TPA: hypothetical protein VK586_01715 [Streptosporangiaceae bacterium]|nr:hypothetical protein [Streptosporangiaceae bacterium]